jgi:hypothetical protein
MTNKIRIHHHFDSIENTFTFQTIIKICESAIEAESSGEWERLEIVSSEDHPHTWYIYGMCWETDKEYEKRMKDLEKTKQFKKKMKQDQEERDKKEYERLKKKFGEK